MLSINEKQTTIASGGRSTITVRAAEKSEFGDNNRKAEEFATKFAAEKGFPGLRVSGVVGPHVAIPTGATDNQIGTGEVAPEGWEVIVRLLSMP